MPHEYLSDEQVGRYGRFVADPTPEELERFFFLDEAALAPQLREPLTDWLDKRLSWPGAATQRALFLNRRGTRLSARGASAVFTAIATAAGLEDPTTAQAAE